MCGVLVFSAVDAPAEVAGSGLLPATEEKIIHGD